MCERDAAPRRVALTVAGDGFLYADGVKLPAKFIPDRGVLKFVDKDRRSASRRGSRYVEVPVAEMIRFAEENSS